MHCHNFSFHHFPGFYVRIVMSFCMHLPMHYKCKQSSWIGENIFQYYSLYVYVCWNHTMYIHMYFIMTDKINCTEM